MTWWKYNVHTNRLVVTARRLLKELGDAPLVGIGQSPYWLGEAMRMEAEKQGSRFKMKSLAFSDARFVSREEDGSFHYRVPAPGNKMGVMPERYRAYRVHLQKNNVTPMGIARLYARTGKKTTFIDYVDSKYSLASFMHILCDWAEEKKVLEEFRAGIGVCAILASSKSHELVKNPPALKLPRFGLNLTVKPLFDNRYTFMYLADASLSGGDDRAVPHYEPKRWGQEPEKIAPAPEVEVIRERLRERIFHPPARPGKTKNRGAAVGAPAPL